MDMILCFKWSKAFYEWATQVNYQAFTWLNCCDDSSFECPRCFSQKTCRQSPTSVKEKMAWAPTAQSVVIKPQVNIMVPPAVMAAKDSSAGASERVMSTPAGTSHSSNSDVYVIKWTLCSENLNILFKHKYTLSISLIHNWVPFMTQFFLMNHSIWLRNQSWTCELSVSRLSASVLLMNQSRTWVINLNWSKESLFDQFSGT